MTTNEETYVEKMGPVVDEINKDVFQQRRKVLGLSQSQLAKKLQTPVKTLQNWEQGERRIPGIAWASLEMLEAEKIK